MRFLITLAGVLAAASAPGLPLCVRDAAAQQSGSIIGTVRDADAGGPLRGAAVAVLGTRFATQTDAEGRYSITGVPSGTHRLRVRTLGYAPADTSVVVDGEQTVLDFRLKVSAIQLDEVVAIGYAQVQRRDVTGAVASVRGEEVLVKAAPTTAVSNALQGKAPGVQVVVNSGVPGSGATVRVRGTASISANSEPLYVIDGLPAVQGTSSQDPTYNPLNEINPNDIESIEILKDASATAVYGARGANGVILISTKRGERGADRVTIESSYGVEGITKRIPVLSGPEFMRLVNEAYYNADPNRPLRYTAEQIEKARTYNYPDMLIRNGVQQSHALTLSGGDDRTGYLISGNYLSQEGILINSDFQRVGLRLNLDRTVSDRFRVGTSLSLTRVSQGLNRTENGGIGASARGILAAMNFDPSLPPKNERGEWTMRAIMGEQLENPVANTTEITDQRNEWRGLGSFFAELDVSDALRLRSTLGTNAHFWRNPGFAPRTIAPGFTVNGRAEMGTGYDREFINENTVTYSGRVGPGDIVVLGGFSAQTRREESSWSLAENFPTDEIQWNNLGAGTGFDAVGTGAGDWALLSILGRVNYSLKDRYLLTVTARRDGSSRFGANNKWSLFPSAAFAWRISDEAFMRDRTPFSDLKLRLSYGSTGSQAVTQYQSLSRMSTTFVGVGPGREFGGLVPAGEAPNPDLKWETTREFNAGLDASLLNNRLTLSLDAYHKVTRDLLLWMGMPRTSGYWTQLRNVGSVRNRGVELGISTVNVQTPGVSWRSTLNLSANRNVVLDLGGQDFVFPGMSRYGWFIDGNETYIVKVGEPLGSIFGYKVNGLWQRGDACYLKKSAECTPGEYRIVDINGDSAITPADRTVLGHTEPTLFGGLSNNLAFGPFTLDVFFNFTYGNKVANASNVFSMLSTGFMNERAEVKNRWTPARTNTNIPRANNARPRRLYSTLVENGSFLRLQTVTLGYSVPRGLIRGPSDLRLYVTGQNLFVLSNYSGFDPEVNSIGGDSRFRGVDVGAYPRARAVNFGVTAAF